MVDFWFNHFNVYILKAAARWMTPAYEREAIRPHALGRFRDLAGGDRAAPRDALLSRQLAEHARQDLVMPRAIRPAAGLNENYARELMELHTLGVDGGYTQQDVTEVARCFTGWSIDRPHAGRRLPCSAPARTTGARSACSGR